MPERPSASLLPAKTTTQYDEWGRANRSDTFSVNPTTGAVSTNSLHSEVWFDERGLPIKSSSPGGLEEKVVYDGLGRATTIYTTDGGGGLTRGEGNNVLSDVVLSQSEIQYDDAGNVLLTTNRERFHDANGIGPLGTATTGVPSRVSYTAMYYDKANRLTDSVDVGTHGGVAYTRPTSVPSRSDTALVSSVEYDSAGRQSKVIDPRGLESRTYYDLLSRTTKTIENYVDGVVSDTDDKTTEFTYGPAGMTSLTAKTSPATGQVTEWVYGVSTATGSAVNSNDVVGATKWPDPSTGASSSSEQETLLVNALGQPISTTDRNGNIHNFEYDIVGRMVSDTVTTLGTGIDGGVRRLETAYNGQGNPYLLNSYDATTGGNVVNQVKREFNGLGQLITEWQSHSGAGSGSTPKVQYAYSEMAGGTNHSRPTSITYPNGRVVSRNYDPGLDNDISRLSSLSDGAVILEGYKYLGLSSVVERSHTETGIELSYIKRLGESNGDAGDQYTGLDRFGRIDDQRWLDATTGTSVDRYDYSYDRNGNRTERDNLVNSSFDETYAYDGMNQLSSFDRSTTRSQSWDYDALGNWDSVTTDSVVESRGHNKQNEITAVSGATSPTYDANGNMTGDETGRQFMYDAWNRLVTVKDTVGTTLTEYGYDAMNHRITENDGTIKDLYYSAGWQVLEEQVGGVTTNSYVWSPVYIDAMIARDRDSDGNGVLDERLYVLHDANFNVTGLVDTSGNIVARFVYDPFGAVTVLNASWGAFGGSGYAWQYLHQGGRLDPVSGLYHFRNRGYSASVGRWNKNDPIGFMAGDVNLVRAILNNPISSIDPYGLQPPEPWEIEAIFNQGPGHMNKTVFGPSATTKGPGYEFDFKKYTQGGWEPFERPGPPDVFIIPNAQGLKNLPVLSRKGVNDPDDCALDVGVGFGLVILGQPIIEKRFVTQGSSPRTSIASLALSKALPYKVARQKGIPAPTLSKPLASTRIVGRALGRWVPICGWIIIGYEVIEGDPTGAMGRAVGDSGDRGFFRKSAPDKRGQTMVWGLFVTEGWWSV